MPQTIKRVMDLAIVIPSILLLSPLLGLIALAVRVKLGAPVLFVQLRPGLGGKTFPLVKFRTMSEDRDESGRLLPDVARLSRFGRFLRSTSLDELPELFNVLKGDMSLVGPRPLLMHYLDRYTPHHARRHEMKPGLTGWAQINGRHQKSFSERFDQDVWYIDHYSLRLDLKILLRTLGQVIFRTGYREQQEDILIVDDLGITDLYRNRCQTKESSTTQG